jgi:protein arginine kinase activator
MSQTPSDPDTCQVCGQNPATVRVRRVTAGDEEELRLCYTCAQERGLEPSTEGGAGGDPVALMLQNLGRMQGTGGMCPSCGMTFAQFQETGRLGCSRCYATFNDELTLLIRRVQGDVRHVGKVPVREGKTYEEAARLRRLNEDLERAIGAEEYERAAEIRDLIQKLEAAGEPGGKGSGS